MKAVVMQPPYSRDVTLADEYFAYKCRLLDACCDADLIVLPEYSDDPCVTSTMEDTLVYHEKYIGILLEKCAQAAKRCKAHVFVNALSREEAGWRNTTYCFDRDGNLAGKYFKMHLPPLELTMGLDRSYAEQYDTPYVLELDGIRYGFLTCYDFYFYEAFPQLARKNLDIIIGCSLQRSDSHHAIETMCRFLAYNTNAFVVRSSVSFGQTETVCGASMIVSPEGRVLMNMEGRFGMGEAEIDPKQKHLKAGGYGNPLMPHHQYIEFGRQPWQYRNGGPSVALFEDRMPYPRICAHRGFHSVAPENTLPAFGAAVAMGAEEIEFDLWATSDGVLVSCHDATLDRVSNGTGKIYDRTYAELMELDFGGKFDPRFAGLKLTTFEEILQKFSGRVIMNIHVKIWDANRPDPMLEQIVGLIRKYDAQRHVYFMSRNDEILKKAMEYAPEIPCCVGWDGNRDPMSMVDRAIALGAKKVQLFKPWFNEETVAKAHAHGIRCNVFWADDPEEAKKYRQMGIDTILTNDYHRIAHALKG